MQKPNEQQKNVLITGGTGGIGKATSELLVKAGYRVIATVRREEDGRKLFREISGNFSYVTMDLANAESIQAAFRQVESKIKPEGLTALINNAGISVSGALEYLALDEIEKQFQINTFSPIRVIQAFLPLLKKSRGKIISVSSLAGRFTTPYAAPYCASKAAFEAMSDALRLELRHYGISVSILQPGPVKTALWEKTENQVLDFIEKMPETGKVTYGEDFKNIVEGSKKSLVYAQTPEYIAGVIRGIIEAKKPKPRYPTSAMVRIMMLILRLLSDDARDKMIKQMMKLE